MNHDLHWMQLALQQAENALALGEVPVGAVVVRANECVAVGHNAPIGSHDPTAHAEIVALRAAAKRLGNYRLEDCELYVTLEPCSMCAGAILQARLKRVIFAAADPKAGALGSHHILLALHTLHHQTQVSSGVLAEPSKALLQGFFRHQRERQRREQAGRALRDDALRTPDLCFAGLRPAPVTSHYVNNLPSLNGLRMHYLDADAEPHDGVDTNWLLLHGPLAWSYCWHEAIAQQHWTGRRLCPDLIGFGRSDKPKKTAAHSLTWHTQTLLELTASLKLSNTHLVAPRSQSRLVEVLLAQPNAEHWSIQWYEPPVLEAAAANAPFPDAGHRAALSAFSALTMPDITASGQPS